MDSSHLARTEAELLERLKDRYWRINNLYWIINEEGQRVLFKMRPAQEKFYREMAYRNAIPKSRQHGFSTFISIFQLDLALFNPNTAIGVVAHERGAASELFRSKIKYPYENLPEALRVRINSMGSDKSQTKPLKDKDGWLILGNGSSVRVSTSMRSGTLQSLHVSELGKICAQSPAKADEVKTGSLNAVHEGGFVFYESTCEGDYGYWYDTCQEALAVAKEIEVTGRGLHPLEFKLHFFGWHEKPENRTSPELVTVSKQTNDYLDALSKRLGVIFDDHQRAWYELVKNGPGGQKHKMAQEHPATMEEAFAAPVSNAYYGDEMAIAADESRITKVAFDDQFPVYTAWDLGISDSMCIWFFQVIGQELRIIDYYENNNQSLAYYIKEVKNKPYIYGRHFAPHDINVRELSTGLTRKKIAAKLGLKFYALPATSVIDGIDTVRSVLPRCYFDITNCAHGIKCLRNYRKEYNAKLQRCEDRPLHDWASHGADAFRYLAVAYKTGKVDGVFYTTSLESRGIQDEFESFDPLDF